MNEPDHPHRPKSQVGDAAPSVKRPSARDVRRIFRLPAGFFRSEHSPDGLWRSAYSAGVWRRAAPRRSAPAGVCPAVRLGSRRPDAPARRPGGDPARDGRSPVSSARSKRKSHIKRSIAVARTTSSGSSARPRAVAKRSVATRVEQAPRGTAFCSNPFVADKPRGRHGPTRPRAGRRDTLPHPPPPKIARRSGNWCSGEPAPGRSGPGFRRRSPSEASPSSPDPQPRSVVCSFSSPALSGKSVRVSIVAARGAGGLG